MARLNFDGRGDSFLDLILIQSESGAGAQISLRLPAVRGRSVVVLYDRIWWGTDLKAAISFVRGIISRRSLEWEWACSVPDKSGFVSIRWPCGSNKAVFSAEWKDEFGTVGYQTSVPAANAKCFRDSVGTLWRALER